MDNKPSNEQVEREFMTWVRENHFSFSQDTNGNINLSKARVMELFVAARRAPETTARAVVYFPCAQHMGQAATMWIGPIAEPIVVCPICHPQSP